jgi:glycosyltransferase involved in cell wall biosynthesis
MMRILVVNDFANVNGGASQVALSSAIGLARAGHSVTLFAAVGPISSELQQDGLEVICTGQQEILHDTDRRRAFLQGLWNRPAAQRFSDLLRDCDPAQTIVHIHGWTKALSSSVAAAALSRKFAVVLTLHDYFSVCPNGAFYHYPGQHPCRLRGLSAACLFSHCDARSYAQKLWRFARGIIQRKFGGIPDRARNFITVSKLSQSILQPYLPAGARLFRIGNPIASRQTEPVNVATNDWLAVVGRITAEKGVSLLTGLDDQKLLFIGDGPLRDEVAKRLPGAHITGWLPHDRALEQLRQARALIFPSLLFETQGMVVLEAAALGIPALVPDTCAAREFVEDGVTGLWFRGGDARDLTAGVERLSDPDFAARLGRMAYERYWSAPPDLERHVHDLEGVYQDILETTRNG